MVKKKKLLLVNSFLTESSPLGRFRKKFSPALDFVSTAAIVQCVGRIGRPEAKERKMTAAVGSVSLAEIQKKRQELEEAEAQLEERKSAALAEIAEADAAIAAAQAQYEESNAALAAEQAEIEAINAQIAELNEQLEQRNNSLEEAKNQLAACEATVKDATGKRETAANTYKEITGEDAPAADAQPVPQQTKKVSTGPRPSNKETLVEAIVKVLKPRATRGVARDQIVAEIKKRGFETRSATDQDFFQSIYQTVFRHMAKPVPGDNGYLSYDKERKVFVYGTVPFKK